MTTTGQAGDARSVALDAYLARREADGYRVETRSGLQAVICRRHRLYFVLRLFARGSAQRRLVVSVDQHGEVTSAPAEPVRW
jgi:hypothetical protein